MNALSRHLKQYLELRHRLGFKLYDTSCELHHFVRFAREEKATHITTKLALQWATQPTGCLPARWGTRLGMLRQFSRYLSAVDPRTEVPPEGLLPSHYHRKTPYLYSDEQVLQLLKAAQQMPSPKGLRAATYSTLFGLLAATGMRLGEAIGLDRQDIDLDQGLFWARGLLTATWMVKGKLGRPWVSLISPRVLFLPQFCGEQYQERLTTSQRISLLVSCAQNARILFTRFFVNVAASSRSDGWRSGNSGFHRVLDPGVR